MPGQTSEGHMSGITKSMLIERIATRYPALSPKDVELAVKAIFDRMSRQLVEGGRIELRGFGSFSLHKRKARVGRNPKTGESVVLDTKAVPHFKPGKELREAVNTAFLESRKS
jgi:integration host factor subunit beta